MHQVLLLSRCCLAAPPYFAVLLQLVDQRPAVQARGSQVSGKMLTDPVVQNGFGNINLELVIFLRLLW
jgi:hypothetical protein